MIKIIGSKVILPKKVSPLPKGLRALGDLFFNQIKPSATLMASLVKIFLIKILIDL